jgi:hypothetical protein
MGEPGAEQATGHTCQLAEARAGSGPTHAAYAAQPRESVGGIGGRPIRPRSPTTWRVGLEGGIGEEFVRLA